jgi:hypothetical protein
LLQPYKRDGENGKRGKTDNKFLDVSIYHGVASRRIRGPIGLLA